MKSRILIINCPNKHFFYVPMGSFGLCDYLSKKNIPAKILNLAVCKENETGKVLKHYLELFQPTHVGVIFHWQETAEGFLRVGEQIKSFNKDIKILSGGFTAGYFGENLLEKCRFLDFVIKGDPEKPIELLLNGVEPPDVPNLIYRSASGIRSNEVTYFIDQETLSDISFSELTYLYDHQLYLDAIDKKLGFPIFIGRGCAHGCRYCGGSCAAFRSHSARVTPVNRSVDAVVADLKRLKDFTRRIYLCYENDKYYIKTLFNAIKEEQSLIKTFHLNYGAWKLLDGEFLDLYKELFVSLGDMKPVFEVSPEVFDDKRRKSIKNGSVYYSIEEMKKNLRLVNKHLEDSVNISIFFSRYHETAVTYQDMKKEIVGIFRLKHALFRENLANVNILYDHLSTDIASRYWEDYVADHKDFDSLIKSMRNINELGFPVDNLCVYMPRSLSGTEILKCESLIFVLKDLEKYFHEIFHIMFKCLDVLTIDILEEIVSIYIMKRIHVFKAMDHKDLLDAIKGTIINKSLTEKIPFIEDLTDLCIKKIQVLRKSYGPGSFSDAGKQKLNYDLISVYDHDYLDLGNFLKRIDKEGAGSLKPEKTVYIFLSAEILAMPYETYELTLKEFEKGISVDEYYKTMKQKGIFTPSYHKNLIDKLFQSSVLF